MSWDRALTDDLFSGFGGLSFAMMSVAFASTGAIITARVVDNAVGRLFLLIGLLLAIGLLCYPVRRLRAHPPRRRARDGHRRLARPTRCHSRQRR